MNIYLSYSLLFLFSNIICPVLIAVFLYRWNKSFSPFELLLCCAGLGNALGSIILYYLLLLIPGNSYVLYFALLIIPYFIIAWFGKNNFRKFFSDIRQSGRKFFAGENALDISVIFICIVLLFFCVSQWIVFNRLFIEHDISEYALQARAFFSDRQIQYRAHHYNSSNGFYYVGLHGFSFLLVSVWELIFNNVLNSSGDFFFRSMTSSYALLLLLLMFYLLSKKSRELALLGSILFAVTSGFIITALIYHIDTYRIFLLVTSLFCLIKFINKEDNLSLLLFGILNGSSAFIHSLSAMIALAAILILFFFIRGGFSHKLRSAFIGLLLTLIFGGTHYILDTFYGTGWIFKDIKFY